MTTAGRWAMLRWCAFAAVATRLVIWVAAMIAVRAVGVARFPSAFVLSGPDATGRTLAGLAAAPIVRWDGDWYLSIAANGYGSPGAGRTPPRTNFFPLYPAVVGALDRLGAPLALAALIVSLVSLIAAMYLLMWLMELELPGRTRSARLAVLALALCPVSVFFSAAYAESLYLALALASILCARRGRWAAAGAFAGLASATRGPGVLLLVPLLVMYLSRPRDATGRRGRLGGRIGWDAAWLALAPAGLIAYAADLTLHGLAPLSFVTTQRRDWHHQFGDPVVTVVDGARLAWRELEAVLDGRLHLIVLGTFPGASVNTGWDQILPFLALLVAIPAVIGVWRRLPPAYGLWVTACLLLNLVTPVSYAPLQSLPRYLAVLFPLYMWLGDRLAEHPRATVVVLTLSGIAMTLLAVEFATWHFVA